MTGKKDPQDMAKDMWNAGINAWGQAQSWDRLGGIFEQRIAQAMQSMGMPTKGEMQALTERVQALESELAALRSAQAAPTGAQGASKPAPKPSSKPASKGSAGSKASKASPRA